VSDQAEARVEIFHEQGPCYRVTRLVGELNSGNFFEKKYVERASFTVTTLPRLDVVNHRNLRTMYIEGECLVKNGQFPL
jgi:hypothetical protein